MAEQSFRDSLRAFNADRADEPASLGSRFSSFLQGDGASESLLSSFQTRTQQLMQRGPFAAEQDQGYFALSRWQRLVGFASCLFFSALCFMMAFITMPMIPIRPQKFALAFSMGSMLVFVAVALLQGPLEFLRSIVARDRLIFTCTYFGSLFLTIIFAMSGYYILTVLLSVIELVSLAWYVISYLPWGPSGFGFFTSYFMRNSSGLPI